MPREDDFWVYIMTNKLDSVLYIGMTNDLTRRVSEHQSGEIPGSRRITDVTSSFIGSFTLRSTTRLRAKSN
jgi:predicted GIY-YIG superfamily endonuclease